MKTTEMAAAITEWLEYCSTGTLINIYNHIFKPEILLTIDDIEVEEK